MTRMERCRQRSGNAVDSLTFHYSSCWAWTRSVIHAVVSQLFHFHSCIEHCNCRYSCFSNMHLLQLTLQELVALYVALIAYHPCNDLTILYFLHFAYGIAEVKCILVTRIYVYVCLSVPCCIPTLLHRPECNLREWQVVSSSCALLGEFAVSAWVSLL